MSVFLGVCCFMCCATSLSRSYQGLWIVRHGEADHNKEERFNSDPDQVNYFEAHLTKNGEELVKRAAESLPVLGVRGNILLLYSPLPRTQETAKIIAENLNVEERNIKPDIRLTEVKVGSWEGKPFKDFPHHFWDLSKFKDFGGEDRQMLAERIRSLLFDLNDDSLWETFDNIVVVTHGSPAKTLIEELTGWPLALATSEFVRIERSIVQNFDGESDFVMKRLLKIKESFPEAVVNKSLTLMSTVLFNKYLKETGIKDVRLQLFCEN